MIDLRRPSAALVQRMLWPRIAVSWRRCLRSNRVEHVGEEGDRREPPVPSLGAGVNAAGLFG